MKVTIVIFMSDAPPPRNHPLTLADVQAYIRRRYYSSDSARGTPGTFMWFIEEVGELSTALQRGNHDEMTEEFADVLAWLTTLANINDVDLTAAFETKYLTGGGPEGHK